MHVYITYRKETDDFLVSDEKGNKVLFKSGASEVQGQGAASYSVSPMEALIMGLGTCSGIDIVMIMNKQRATFDSFDIEISAHRKPFNDMSLWSDAHMVYLFHGTEQIEKAEKAVALSIDKYCSVAETLRRAGCSITYECKQA